MTNATTTDRVSAYMIRQDGSRAFSLRLRGMAVLITADEGQHDEARALAEQIAAMGPEKIPEPPAATPRVAIATAPRSPRPAFVVGQRVRCNVHGAAGECTIVEVGEGRNRGRVKITGERMWCPAGNFDAI